MYADDDYSLDEALVRNTIGARILKAGHLKIADEHRAANPAIDLISRMICKYDERINAEQMLAFLKKHEKDKFKFSNAIHASCLSAYPRLELYF